MSSELDLARWLRPGDGIVVGQHSAEPVALVEQLLAQSASIGPLSAFVGLSWSRVWERSPGDSLALSSWGALGRVGRLAGTRSLDVISAHYSSFPRLFAERVIAPDVVLVQVAPAVDGEHSLGVGIDYLPDAIAHARVVIAEVNAQMPRTFGTTIPAARVDVAIATDRPLLEAPAGAPGDAERRIAAFVAERVQDGDTIQIGVGVLPSAIVRALAGHRALGVHSGMVGDAIVELVESGVIDGSRKPRDAGKVLSGAALATSFAFSRLHEHEAFEFRPVSYTHHPAIASTAGRLVAINGAAEVDLLGQAGAESVAGRPIGALGGQSDFLRAAVASGGAGIVALPSLTPKGGSRIVPSLSGPVSTGRPDMDLVITEHGVAELRGRTAAQKAQALIAIADPAHRDALAASLRD